ncbi:MAG: tetratricopeptide repeat protein [Fidelibacterota bacterium]|nr:MAG: tetratricopeptide repeat protein [Candidatus Neomarinimicrobiota bacterium]
MNRIVWPAISTLLLVVVVSGQIRDPYADALRYFELGRYEQAATSLQKILEREPECMECYDLLARIATSQGDDSLAAAWYRRASEIEPDNATLYQKLGFAEHRAGNLLRAVDDLERSLQLNPASGETYFALGNVWYDLEALEQAKASYRQALALDSTAAAYHFQLGMVYFKTDLPDSALIEFQATYQLYPKYSLAYEFAANILIKESRWPEVVDVLERGLASAPETRVTRYWLGRGHLEMGNFQRAVELLGGYVIRYKDHIGARYNYGLALYEIGEYEEAVTQLCTVTVHLPDLLKAQLYLGRSLSGLDRDSLAFAVFDSLLFKDSTYYEVWIYRGDIDLKRDRYPQAMAQYVLAGKLRPDRWEAYHRQALAHYLQGQYEAAELQLFGALIRKDSLSTSSDTSGVHSIGSAVIYGLLGDVAAAMGEDDFSTYYYSMVLRLEPENIAARAKLVDALIRRQMWRVALAELGWFYERDRRNETVLYRLGRVSHAYGDTTATRQYMDEFRTRHNRRRERERLELRISLDRRNPRHYRELGWYYRRLENYSRARLYFRQAVALGDTTLPASLYMDEGEGP